MRRRSPLARQILVLALVLCTVVLVLAFPLRSYLAGRSSLATADQGEQQLQQQLDALQVRKAALQDPDYIRQQARHRLQYANPGETIYAVLMPAPAVLPDGGAAKGVPATGPWYSHLWGTLSATGPVASSTRSSAPSSGG